MDETKNQSRRASIRICFSVIVFACLPAIQTNCVLAQTTNYNQVDWSHVSAKEMLSILKNATPAAIPTNAWTSILDKLKWSLIPTNDQAYILRNVSMALFPTNFDIYGLAASIPPPTWPDSPEKLKRLKQSVDILRSAVDTNRLAFLEKELMNQLEYANPNHTHPRKAWELRFAGCFTGDCAIVPQSVI